MGGMGRGIWGSALKEGLGAGMLNREGSAGGKGSTGMWNET